LTAYGELRSLLEASPNPAPAETAEQLDDIKRIESDIDLEFLMSDTIDLIRESREGTDRIKKIVIDLKDFAHPGQHERMTADINRNIESVLNIVWNELKYNATVQKDFGDLPPVECYPQQLNQVFMNLLVNAGHAMQTMGEIHIATRTAGDHVEIAIRDTGCGIPEENLKRIFDPFFTTKPVGKGTGLGLNVAYNIIKKHGGEIKAASQVGEGTTFTIRLPIELPENIAPTADRPDDERGEPYVCQAS
jgi:two-component system, NtrC family, sensor kinase